MIVQTAPEGEPHLVIIQTDHAILSGTFAQAFSNEQFAPVVPMEQVAFTAKHHDHGWVPVDSRVVQDKNTGLPYNLTQTPLEYLVKTSAGSPAYNEDHHPYCGILSSMHTYGLFNGRYGMNDMVFIDLIPQENKPAVELMLRRELDRQERLIEQLNTDEETAGWVREAHLFHNYKLLQFFDTLALYFQMTHEQARSESSFPNVPQEIGQDVTITIRPVKSGLYALSPYPFKEEELNVTYQGRYMRPEPVGTDLKPILDNSKLIQEHIKLIAG